jgi:hypothetical protein
VWEVGLVGKECLLTPLGNRLKVSAKRLLRKPGIQNVISTLFEAQFGNVDASLEINRSKMGTQRVPVVALVAIASVDDAPVLLVPVVDVAVVLVAALPLVLVPVALAPVDETPVSTAAVSVFTLLSLLQPTASAVTTSRTATDDLFMRNDSSMMIFRGAKRRKDERTALNERL